MSDYKHQISTTRTSDIVTAAVEGAYNVQVVVGTAPINQLDDPSSAVNKPIVVRSRADVKKYFGWSSDFQSYTLMQAAYASFQMYAVAPIIMINVLDPAKATHVTAKTEQTLTLTSGTGTVEEEGIVLSTLAVKMSGTSGVIDTDYVAAFDADGYLTITVTSDGAFASATELTLSYSVLKPSGVTATDIIGGTDADGVRTGIDLIDEIYAQKSILPGVLSAPGFSHEPTVAAALETKAELAGDFSNAIAVVDIESSTTKKIADVAAAKKTLGVMTRWSVACWPAVKSGDYVLYYSAVVSALLQNICIQNGNIPAESPDNLDVAIDGLCLIDGTEVHYTQAQVNDYLNANGIVSAIYMGGWKCWGNNTAAYPYKKDPSDRFIKCVVMCNYLENKFKTQYLSKIGRNASRKVIDAIVTDCNASFNMLTPDYVAGAEIVFRSEDNPIANILEGHLVFKTRYADYTPIEWIENTFIWDSSILEAALAEGDEE